LANNSPDALADLRGVRSRAFTLLPPRKPERAHRGRHITNFAALQNAVVISKMQWFGVAESHLLNVSPIFSATRNLLTFAL
jgi:hypothetical protein